MVEWETVPGTDWMRAQVLHCAWCGHESIHDYLFQDKYQDYRFECDICDSVYGEEEG